MANVSIKFNGKEFLLSCDDGQEEHLEELLIQLNKKFNELKNNLGNLGENKLLLITAVKVMDEYYETKKKVEQKKNEFKELSNKFRELKSLVYDYRDKKEDEIKNLNEKHHKLKEEIENNKKNYEKIIDQTADEISNFIDKTNSEKLSYNKVNKSSIRKKLLRLRKKKYQKNQSPNPIKIYKFLKNKVSQSKIIGGYYPFNYELNILNILKVFENNDFTISLPKIMKNNEMNFFKWSKKEPLKINKFGIPEPISNKKVYPKILLIPLVAFDDQLNRLGYGGGYYDRYLSRVKNKNRFFKVGLGFSFQKVKNLPVEKYDKSLDCIITEKKIIE